VKYFEGTPIPTSFVVVCVLMFAGYLGAVAEHLWWGEITLMGHVLHPLALIYALSGSLMISRMHIPKL
jgi:CDP-diacylglycerol--serine O-phosphatidyltransferase